MPEDSLPAQGALIHCTQVGGGAAPMSLVSRLRRLLLPCLVALGVLLVGLGSLQPELVPALKTIRKGTWAPLPVPPAGAQVVTVGLYAQSIYDLDLSSNTFYADVYVWLRWKGPIDPSASIEFANMVEEWGKLQEPLNEPVKTLLDGSSYQIFRVEGRFVQPFTLADYPLDRHTLSLQIEDTIHGVDQLTYAIDRASSGVSKNFQIPGWQMAGWKAEVLEHSYGTNFGDPGQASAYAAAVFDIIVRRPTSFFLTKLFLPLLIVVTAALIALLVHPRAIDARLALPLGSLLSAIFLQKSYTDTLPDLGYLILMDRIYLLAYPLILAVLVRAIWSFLTLQSADEECFASIRRGDRIVLKLLLLSFASGTTVLLVLR